jgi:hypothetical protein
MIILIVVIVGVPSLHLLLLLIMIILIILFARWKYYYGHCSLTRNGSWECTCAAANRKAQHYT